MTIHVQRQETPPGMLKKPFLFAEMKKKVLFCKKIEHGVMKKTLLLILLISGLSSVAFSQDTVRYGDPWYQFYPLSDMTMRCCTPLFFHDRYCNSPSHEMDYIGYVNENNPIYGIAVVMDSLPGQDWNFMVALLRGIKYHENNNLGNIYCSIDSLYAEDTIKSWEASLIKRCQFKYFFNDSSSSVHNCFEFYFDTPFVKTEDLNSFSDTFFVGMSYCPPDLPQISNICSFLPNACFLGTDDSVITINLRLIWYSNEDMCAMYQTPLNQRYYNTPLNYWGGIFPIIGRRCSVPRGLTLEADSSSVHWSSDTDAELFQLSICNHMWTDPDDGTIFTTTSTTQALPSMSPDSNYYIYLRKQCAFREDSVWSDWSEPLRVGARPPAGILEVDNPKLTLEVSPNPTDGTVAVRHTATEGTLTVTDLQGREIQTIKQLHNQTITLDLGPLPQGTYIVTLSTPSGTASQTVIKN